MTVIIKNRDTGETNSVCVCCRDGDKHRWVSHKMGIIFPEVYTSRQAAIDALDKNPKITWEKCDLRYEVIK